MNMMADQGGAEAYDHHRGSDPLLRPTRLVRLWSFLTINFVGFILVNAFWKYLCTGRWVNFTPAGYHADLATPLGEVLLRPLNVFTHPWMIAVGGLLLGVLIFVPIIVAVLYRLLLSGLFVAVVAVVGHAPALAVAVAIGCILAARTPLRSDMPFLAAFLGLAPVALYLFLLGLTGLDMAAVLPLRRWILRVPFLVALVSAVVSAALVLALARVTKFRPGVLWPVLAVLLAVPMVIFHTKIGPAELDYALIVDRLASGEAIFQSESLASWQSKHGAAGLNPQALRIRLTDDLKLRRKPLIEACERFLRRHPTSRQAPGVLWILARARSLQFDREALDRGWIQYTDAYPLPASAHTWQRLYETYPGSPQVAVAQWRLAELALRTPAVQQADDLLNKALPRLRERVPLGAARHPADPAEVFSEPAVLPSEAYYAGALFRIERLIWLIEQNRMLKDPNSADAMAALMNINRCALTHHEYYAQLAELAGQYEGTAMGENLKLEVAKATEDLNERTNQLVPLARQWSDSDAAIEANYELGQLVVREPRLRLRPDMDKPETYFRAVIDAPPNPWQRRAAEQLAWLRVAARSKQGP